MVNNLHHRRSIRFPEYDYASEGGYFITIVTHERANLFGEIIHGEMKLNAFGKIVTDEWFHTTQLRPNIELFEDEFVVMPNHVHGIVWITDPVHGNAPVGTYRDTPLLRSPSNTVGAIVRGFKGSVTTRINIQRHAQGVPVWQRNYYERIIRDEQDYEAIANYIYNNPLSWETDDENR